MFYGQCMVFWVRFLVKLTGQPWSMVEDLHDIIDLILHVSEKGEIPMTNFQFYKYVKTEDIWITMSEVLL